MVFIVEVFKVGYPNVVRDREKVHEYEFEKLMCVLVAESFGALRNS